MKYYFAITLTVIQFMKLEQLIVKHSEDGESSGSLTGVNDYHSFFGR